MTLQVDIRHRFQGFSLEARFRTGDGITALFGRSGAGKSTVIHAIAGLLRPDEGQITLDGAPFFDAARKLCVPPHKRGLATVFQEARLFPHLTLHENLRFATRYQTGRDGPSEAEVVDLLGLAHLLERTPATLSGGEKQRGALGRALLSHPRLLLMDEPLASLDAPRKQEILPYLERLRDGPLGLPILYVSHAVDEIARLADHLLLLDQGRITAQGPLEQMMADPAIMPALGVREAGAVVPAKVTGHDADGISRLLISAGLLELPGVQAPVGSTVRLRIPAQDVILSRTEPVGLSSVNVLPVTVVSLRSGDGPGAAIQLQAGEDRLLARVTARAVKDLDLHPGVACFAIIKATAVAPGNIGR